MTQLHRNEYGVEINRYDYAKRSAIKVQDEKFGTMMTYRINNIPLYEHKYLSWANLDMCNGWRHNEAHIIENINNGTKVAGSVTVDTKHDDFKEAEAELKKLGLKSKDHAYAFFNKWYVQWSGGYWHWIFFVIPETRLADYFDMDEIREAYERQGVAFSDREWRKMNEYANEYIKALPYEYMSPQKDIELVTTGLLFGYPIETTASLLLGY